MRGNNNDVEAQKTKGKWLWKRDKGNQIVRRLLNNDKYKGDKWNFSFLLIKYKRALIKYFKYTVVFFNIK